ncbi:OmpA family protein [Vibrio owensii]|uniref:OmpA family protein n=1 Tax=Vibrio owensii TaxID=696485 RepID=UPI0005F0845B|nr:OmpA family protein [Vibrio owensii]
MKKRILSFLSLTVSFNILSAETIPHGFFVGAQLGRHSGLDATYSYDNPTANIWGLNTGVQWSEAWSTGLGYQDLGSLKASATRVVVDTKLINAKARYDWHFRGNLSLYTEGGFALWKLNKNYQNHKGRYQGLSPLLGTGINYKISPNIRAYVGYQYIQGVGESLPGRYDSHVFLTGMTWQFYQGAQKDIAKASGISIERNEKKEAHINEKSCGESMATKMELYNVYFKVGSNSPIDADAYTKKLALVVALLCEEPDARAFVKGYSSPEGSQGQNLALSEWRVKAVIDALIKSGIDLSRIKAFAEGEDKQVERFSDARRVEIVVR